ILIGLVSQASRRLEYHGPVLYVYPHWAEAVGWLITASSMFMIPLWMVITICRQPGSFRQKLLLSITPESEHASVMQTSESSRLEWNHWFHV
ncbi:hypothetical protein SK128_024573, partial [Halocaridina rubra]